MIGNMSVESLLMGTADFLDTKPIKLENLSSLYI